MLHSPFELEGFNVCTESVDQAYMFPPRSCAPSVLSSSTNLSVVLTESTNRIGRYPCVGPAFVGDDVEHP